MANITVDKMSQNRRFGNAPFGNMAAQTYHLATNSTGVALNTDVATAVQATDVVRLGVLQAGFKIQDCQIIRSAVFSAGSTGTFGFLYVDGVDDATSPQDAAYFASALALDATGVSRKTGVKAPQLITKDAYIVMTNNTAAQAVAGVVDIIVIGVDDGGSGL